MAGELRSLSMRMAWLLSGKYGTVNPNGAKPGISTAAFSRCAKVALLTPKYVGRHETRPQSMGTVSRVIVTATTTTAAVA